MKENYVILERLISESLQFAFSDYVNEEVFARAIARVIMGVISLDTSKSTPIFEMILNNVKPKLIAKT